MNRIILIGNGFDLAHGLPTRYEDFINWYWEKRVDSFTGNLTPISEDCLCSIKITSDNYNRYWNVFASNLPRYINKPSGKRLLIVLPMTLNLLSFCCLRFLRIYALVLRPKGGLT